MKLKYRLCMIITIAVIACTQWVPAFAVSEADLDLQAQAAIVMDAETGDILYEKDADSKREPASTTKIITCMLALEYLDMDEEITASKEPNHLGTNIDVKKGETLTVEQLLYGLMLGSANDAAVVLAEKIAGSVEEFCLMMDEKAAACGARNTHFRNPNGLNWKGQEDHLTTAYDLAVITREAMRDETFRKLVSTTTYKLPATNKHKERKLVNTNKCLWYKKPITIERNGKKIEFTPYYEGALGVKTGLTSTAGACLVGAAERNGVELISVVLHSGNDGRFDDTIQLWDYVFDNFYNTRPVVAQGEEAGKVRVKMGAKRNVTAVAAEDASVTVRRGEDEGSLQTVFEKMELEAPVQRGDKVGVIKVYSGDQLISQADAVAESTVERGGPLAYFGIPDWLSYAMAVAAVLLILIILVNHRMNHYIRRRRPQKATRKTQTRKQRRQRRKQKKRQKRRSDV